MSGLDNLHTRIKERERELLLPLVMKAAAVRHYNHGFKGLCDCEVCRVRSNHADRMRRGGGYCVGGMWQDVREKERDLSRAHKNQVLAEFGVSTLPRQAC